MAIGTSIWLLEKSKKFAWDCGLQHIPWQNVKSNLKSYQIREKGRWLEVAMAYLFGFMNLPMRISFAQEDDKAGADLVFKKTGINEPLRIQLKRNNYKNNDAKYEAKGIVVVHVDYNMDVNSILKQFHFERLLGEKWDDYFANHKNLISKILKSI